MIKVLLTISPLVNGKLSDENYAWQAQMSEEGFVTRNQRAARFKGEGRGAVRLMDDDWHFMPHNVSAAKHAYIQVGKVMIEVKFTLEDRPFKRLEVGKVYRVTKTASVEGWTFREGQLVTLIGQECEGYTGSLVYRVQKVNSTEIGWAAEEHNLELV